MDIVRVDGIDLLALTYEEEQNLARAVMDCIAMREVRGEFQVLLDRVYEWKGKTGYWPRVDDIIMILDYMKQYGIPEPVFHDDGKNIKDDLDRNLHPTAEDRKQESCRMVIQAWREVWERHDAHKAVADVYLTFPGDMEREHKDEFEEFLAEQIEIEREFWLEVDRLVVSMNCSRTDAIRMASDYMMRGDVG